MASGKEIRNKIKSVENTRKITKAMEMVAASKMRKAQDRMRAARPYGEKIRRVAANLSHALTEYKHPFLIKRDPVQSIGFILVTSDKGLCGGLNTRLLHMCITQMLSWQAAGREVSVTVIGARGLGAMRRAGARIVAQAVGVADLAPDDVTALMGAVAVPLHQFIDGRIDELFVATNRFINALSFEPVLARILPFSRELAELPAVHAGEVAVPYL